MLKLFRSKFIIALLLIAAILLIGTIGYRYISDFAWLDALYMTVITVTTVGFMEVRPLDDESIRSVKVVFRDSKDDVDVCCVFCQLFQLHVASSYGPGLGVNFADKLFVD